jgi:hypothetical protein
VTGTKDEKATVSDLRFDGIKGFDLLDTFLCYRGHIVDG